MGCFPLGSRTIREPTTTKQSANRLETDRWQFVSCFWNHRLTAQGRTVCQQARNRPRIVLYKFLEPSANRPRLSRRLAGSKQAADSSCYVCRTIGKLPRLKQSVSMTKTGCREFVARSDRHFQFELVAKREQFYFFQSRIQRFTAFEPRPVRAPTT